jgi:hypothetical protein
MTPTQPVHRPGRDERVVTRLNQRGDLEVRVERLAGRTFASGPSGQSELITGYVTDARLMLDVLGSLRAPSHFFQVWMKLLSMQKLGTTAGNIRGYVKVSQRELQKRCGLPASSVNEAMQYWSELPWVRTVKRGLLQTNPFLTAAGSSAEHAEWQTEWSRAVGESFLVPGPNHPAAWREERVERKAAEKRLRALPGGTGINVLPLKGATSGKAASRQRIPTRSTAKGA